jgi:hypothetical protein
MTSAHLRPCPSCSRHARVTESTCPFCAAPFDDAFRAERPRPRAPAMRLTRAALLAIGAGGLTAGAACGGETSQGAYGAVVASEAGVDAAAYGTPDAALVDAAHDFDGRIIVAADYGAPPMPPCPPDFDCSPVPFPDAASDASDASPEGSAVADAGADALVDPCGPGTLCALYGGPAIGH